MLVCWGLAAFPLGARRLAVLPSNTLVICDICGAGARSGSGTKRGSDSEKENPAKKPKTVKSAKGAARKGDPAVKQAAAMSPAKSPAKAAGKGVKRPRNSDGALSDSTNAAEDVIVGSGRQVGLSANARQLVRVS